MTTRRAAEHLTTAAEALDRASEILAVTDHHDRYWQLREIAVAIDTLLAEIGHPRRESAEH